ncbi:MAG: hypothetical protein LBQ12_03580 [Deltaproteobacteria bacterium]|jgi:hypothetical protein|nr:hypothetical protein [Deltaproteobacteria bacterium]
MTELLELEILTGLDQVRTAMSARATLELPEEAAREAIEAFEAFEAGEASGSFGPYGTAEGSGSAAVVPPGGSSADGPPEGRDGPDAPSGKAPEFAGESIRPPTAESLKAKERFHRKLAMAMAPKAVRPERSWGHLIVSGLLFAFLIAAAAAGMYRMIRDGGAREASARSGEFLFFAPQESEPSGIQPPPGGQIPGAEAVNAPASAMLDNPPDGGEDDDDYVPEAGAYAPTPGSASFSGYGVLGDPATELAYGGAVGSLEFPGADGAGAEAAEAATALNAEAANALNAEAANVLRAKDAYARNAEAADVLYADASGVGEFFRPQSGGGREAAAAWDPDRQARNFERLAGGGAVTSAAAAPSGGPGELRARGSAVAALPATFFAPDPESDPRITTVREEGLTATQAADPATFSDGHPAEPGQAPSAGSYDASAAAAPAPKAAAGSGAEGKGIPAAAPAKAPAPKAAVAKENPAKASPAEAVKLASASSKVSAKESRRGSVASPARGKRKPASASGLTAAGGKSTDSKSPASSAASVKTARKDGVITATVRPGALRHPPSAGDDGERGREAPGARKAALRKKGPVRRVVGRISLASGTALAREELQGLLRGVALNPDSRGEVRFKGPGGESLAAATTLDPELQAEAVKWVRNAGSIRAALVAVDPRDGRVLAMASLGGGKDGPGSALTGEIPAASVFKIVTAAAAMERNKYDRKSAVLYDGGKHTLFKSNVVKAPDRGIHKASLEAGFAESINSVFGKLGVYTLGPDELHAYAEKVGFNRLIPFDMEVDPSVYEPGDPDDPFRLAELSSGYNRTTTVSPLHAALIAGGVMADGLMAEPWVVRAVKGPAGRELYRREARPLMRVMSRKTAGELYALMLATVTDGTGRRGFWDASTHRTLSRLALGGKSGTINDLAGRHVDWFVASAALKDPADGDRRPLAIAAVVVHGGRTRETSQELVRKAVISYYGPLLKHSRGPGRAS